MGADQSTSGRGKKVIASKLDSAMKTGVLNFADQDLKAFSPVWESLMLDGLNIKIKTLDISGNGVKGIPNEVLAAENMKIFHASRCSIQRTPDMTMLIKLQQINLDQNDLESDVIGPLPISLKYINLSVNHFASFPEALYTLVSLTELNLSGNRLSSIDGVEHLVSLVSLNLDDNVLKEVIADFSILRFLKFLSVQRNLLQPRRESDPTKQSFSEELFTKTSLDHLTLTGNSMLCKADVLKMSGVDSFLERRKRLKDKALQQGALTDHSLFGIE